MSSIERQGDWIETFTGRKFWPLDPRPEDVCIEDIAHALSLICRFNGHCKHFYSVSQHSIMCAKLADMRGYDSRIKLLSLLHDAAEAYIMDIPRPLKPFISGYREAEHKIQLIIYQALGIKEPSFEEKILIKQLDTVLLITEGKILMPFIGWSNILGVTSEERISISETSPSNAEKVFMDKFNKYVKAGINRKAGVLDE